MKIGMRKNKRLCKEQKPHNKMKIAKDMEIDQTFKSRSNKRVQRNQNYSTNIKLIPFSIKLVDISSEISTVSLYELLQTKCEHLTCIKQYVTVFKVKFEKIVNEISNKKLFKYNSDVHKIVDSDKKIVRKLMVLNNLQDKLMPIETKKDGNCLFNSISMLLYNDSSKYYLIRLGLLYIILKYEVFFRYLLKKTKTNEQNDYHFLFLLKAALINGEWGDEYVLQAISILTKRYVYCYSYNPINAFAYVSKYGFNCDTKLPLTLALLAAPINHFICLMCNTFKQLDDLPESTHEYKPFRFYQNSFSP